ncbi:GGDEF domain-containing protein [Pseudomonas sp. DC3000-4b1]|uniref:GGDEF domain-containing protein n=1 Tax=unclassified Pseudomonas TaxID=196821 RepID=UPI003CEB8936
MHNGWRSHLAPLLLLALAANVVLVGMLMFGRVKGPEEWIWIDILGEGGSALLNLVWLGLVLKSRPAGRVTRYLMLGLSLVFIAGWADWLDEFIRLPASVPLGHFLESSCMPVGLLLVTWGIYHWHREQLAINARMAKREQGVRDHESFDALTPLATADYLKARLPRMMATARRAGQPLSLVALDVCDFRQVNDAFGYAEGDALLSSLSNLLLLNLRRQDLLCRLAGDRFAVVLPGTGEQQAGLMAAELAEAVASLAHRTTAQGERIRLRARVCAVMARDETPEQLLQRVSLGLARAANLARSA